MGANIQKEVKSDKEKVNKKENKLSSQGIIFMIIRIFIELKEF